MSNVEAGRVPSREASSPVEEPAPGTVRGIAEPLVLQVPRSIPPPQLTSRAALGHLQEELVAARVRHSALAHQLEQSLQQQADYVGRLQQLQQQLESERSAKEVATGKLATAEARIAALQALARDLWHLSAQTLELVAGTCATRALSLAHRLERSTLPAPPAADKAHDLTAAARHVEGALQPLEWLESLDVPSATHDGTETLSLRLRAEAPSHAVRWLAGFVLAGVNAALHEPLRLRTIAVTPREATLGLASEPEVDATKSSLASAALASVKPARRRRRP